VPSVGVGRPYPSPVRETPEPFSLRSATRADIPEILRLVRELADYEREPEAVEATEELYGRWLFPTHGTPTAYTEVAEVQGRVVAIALWYPTFSTWTGSPGIWLEDLFVEPDHRGAGIGRALLRRLAGVCQERGYRRLEWWVLGWNTPSIEFYEALGAVAMDEWRHYRLDGAALAQAGRPPSR